MKAILVTKKNREMLTERYKLDDGFLEFSSGLYLVANFGGTMYEGLFTRAAFQARFVETGKKLLNGFVEVETI